MVSSEKKSEDWPHGNKIRNIYLFVARSAMEDLNKKVRSVEMDGLKWMGCTNILI